MRGRASPLLTKGVTYGEKNLDKYPLSTYDNLFISVLRCIARFYAK